MHRSHRAVLFAGLVGLTLACASAAPLQPFRMPWNDGSSTVTSLQSWQPTEAGAVGWVTADTSGHYQVGGQRIRFLGVNVTAADAFPTATRADAHAARLAKFGFNSVRFHHLEAPWDKDNVLVNYAAGNSRSLSAQRLDRLHRFVDALAKKGIYSDINLLVSREFQPGDGLGAEITQLGWKDQHILGFFHDGALALHKEYATQLLSAPNPYRGNRPLAQDPAVSIVEIMNENGFIQKWLEGVVDRLPAPYATALRDKWNDWLKTRYSTDAALLAAWGKTSLPSGQSLSTSSVANVRKTPTDGANSAEQTRDWFRFSFERERIYWEAMQAHIRSLGFQGVVFATIVSNSPPNSQAGLDAMDSHSYWSHPQFPPGQDFNAENWTVANEAMVNAPDRSTLATLSRQRVKGKPHNVTEIQNASPNDYSSEGSLLAAAYGAFQDWDGIWMFEYKTGEAEFTTGFFDHGGHAGKMVNNLLAASFFRRADVAPAIGEDVFKFTPETEVEIARTKGWPWSISDGAQFGVSALAFTQKRLALSIGTAASGLSSPPPGPALPALASDTGELVWDLSVSGKGIVKVNTPATKAVIGFPNGRSFTLDGVTIAPGQTNLGFCTIGLTMVGSGRIGDSGPARALLVATGQQENTGQVWKDSTRTSLGSKWGSAPVLVEVVPATITLPYTPAEVRVWALDGSGNRGASVAVASSGGKAQFTIGGAGATLWYEIAIGDGDPIAPSISTQPETQVVAPGETAVVKVGYKAVPAPTFQWYKDGVALPGATTATLTVPNVQAGDQGTYRVTLTNASGTATSLDARLLLAGSFARPDSRLINLSTRAKVGTGGDILIAGFTLDGSPRRMLVRGTGPILGRFGVPGVLADPRLDLFSVGSSTAVLSNDNWDSSLAPSFQTLGAFALDGSPKEAALLETMPDVGLTAQVKGADGGTGVALVELYNAAPATSRLINLSSRAIAGSEVNALFVGFSLEGTAPMKVLIRGLGPVLKSFGIGNAIEDPVLTLFRLGGAQPIRIAENDDWGQAGAGISDTFQKVTFALPTGSKDSALLLRLEPGLYSARVESKTGSGVALVELFEVE